MNKQNHLLKTVVLAMLVALGVVISPILRVEGMCPMAHFINIVASVLMGPWYSLLCAILIGIIRMTTMGIPPIALTGAIFGAFLSGTFYRASRGKLLFAVIGEVIGTGIIGAVLSYPVMSLLWGKEGLGWLFYVPSFVCGTLIGGSIAFVFLKKIAKNGILRQFQEKLGTTAYIDKDSHIEDSFAIAAMGVIFWLVMKIPTGIFRAEGAWWNYLSLLGLGVFILIAVIYYFKHRKEDGNNE